MLRWILYAGLTAGGLIAAVVIIGVLLPKQHQASRTATYAAPPAEIFAVIADVARYADWRAGVSRIDMLPDDGGGLLYREHGADGPITYRLEVVTPPVLMRSRIADTSLAFGGSWTFELAASATGGTTLTITEDGEVYNPIFRFMSKYVFSPTATIEKYQQSLRNKLGE